MSNYPSNNTGEFWGHSNEYNQQYHSNGQVPPIPSYEDAINPEHQRRIPPTTSEVTPYLGLRARLSQVWFNRWTLLLFLIMVRVLLATQSMDSDLESARDKSLSACTGVESMGSAMASMPHYMSKGVNEMAANGIELTVKALQASLLMLITAIQEIVIFIINLATSTYLCLITFAVKGSVGLVVDATKEITDFINKTLKEITDGVQKDVKSLQDTLNKVTSSIEKVPNFFGAGISIPQIDLPSLDKLSNVKIPTDFTKKLESFEESIPDFKTVQKAANDVIRVPFQRIHNSVNSTLAIYKFDRSVFPVPQKEKLSFCSDNPTINNFFKNLVDLVTKIKWALVGVLIALALIAMAPMAWMEICKWHMTRSRAYMLADPNKQFDPIDVVIIASRPTSSTIGLKLASRSRTPRQQALIRWAVAYITSPPALFVLALGVAGLISVLCQYIMLKQVEAKSPGLAQEVGQFAGVVMEKLTDASEAWGNGTNKAIATTNTKLNDELFGWVKEGTDSLNSTLNVFVDTMSDGIDSFLGNSPLKSAVKDVLDCLIVFKVQGIQKAITWVHDHAKITLPQLPPDTFSIGAAASISGEASGSESFLSSPDSIAADQITDVVMKLTSKWEKMLQTEAIISGCIVGIWLIVVLIALVRTAILWFRHEKTHGEGGLPITTYSDARGGANAISMARMPTTSNQSAFPRFDPSPSDAYAPKSPIDLADSDRDAGIRMGAVRAGKDSMLEPSRQRDSIYPTTDYKR